MLVALAALAAFAPALRGGFLAYDDEGYIARNAAFLAGGWKDPAWAFHASGMQAWAPLSYLSYGLDYALWGLNPLGFHLTNLLLHALAAVLFYLVCLRLLSGGRLAAAFAALFFAVHPLRAESVAWIAERRDVLCGSFLLASLLSYLKAADGGRGRRAWLAASLAAYAAALLSKTVVVTYAAALLVLDALVLRRRAWLEKVPYLLVGLAVLPVNVAVTAPLSLEIYGPMPRLCQALFAPGFYLWKTIWPSGLSPMYELSRLTRPGLYAACGTLTLLISFLASRRRWLAAAWLIQLALLLPLLGLVKTGEAAAADRYTYLALLPWAALFGAGLRRLEQRRPVVVLAGLWLCALFAASWRQTARWRGDEALWRHACAVDPGSTYAHANLSAALARAGRSEEARSEEALASLSPAHDYHERGQRAYERGDFGLAEREFRLATEIEPALPSSQNDLGLALMRLGSPAAAAEHFRFALAMRPDFAGAASNLKAAQAARP